MHRRTVRYTVAVGVIGSALLPLLTGAVAGVGACPTTLPDTIAALFEPNGSCDANGDGISSAADVVAAVTALLAAPTPTNTPVLSITPGSVTPTATTTPSLTPTPRPCPANGATLVFEIDNQTGADTVNVTLSGAQLDTACAGDLGTTYSLPLICSGRGVVSCGEISGLAPGWWRHSFAVTSPRTRQRQH